jgi:hypothetical protein
LLPRVRPWCQRYLGKGSRVVWGLATEGEAFAVGEAASLVPELQ